MTSKPPSQPSATRGNSRWLFRLALILTPFFLLFLLEVLARLVSPSPANSLFIDTEYNPHYLTVNQLAGKPYFTGESFGAFGTQDVLRREKTDSTLRIFVLGGSTTAGYPYMYSGTFAAIMKGLLQQSYPHWEIEVINLGMTAVNSYTVRDFARECLSYDPDLLLIYAGHNEFYGALGSASSQHSLFGTNRTLTLLYLKLKRLRLFQLLQNLIHQLQPQKPSQDSRTLMARMAQNQAIPYNSPLYKKTLSIFQRNLQDIIRWTQQQQIPLLLGTLVSNLKDQPPFVSLHEPQANPQTVDSLLKQIETTIDQQHYQSALNQLQNLLSYDSTYAKAYYLAGRCYEALQQFNQAREYYTKARDYDALRFRASSDLNDIIHELAQQNLVFLSPIDSLFSAHSPNGIVGKNLLLEHLHPNLDGYFLMGKTFAQTILQQRLLNQKHPNLPTPQPLPPDSILIKQIAITTLDKQIAEYRVQILTSGWPFTSGNRYLTLDDFVPQSPVQKQALAVLKRTSNYEKAHVHLAEYYERNGQLESAVKEYYALATTFPINESPLLKMGRLLVQLQRYDQALPILKKSMQFVNDYFSVKWAGTIHLQRQEVEAALPLLQRAHTMNPRDAQTMYNLSGAYFLNGDTVKALETIERLLQTNPDFPDAKTFQTKLSQAIHRKTQ